MNKPNSDWNREYAEKSVMRASFLFKKIGEYVSLGDKRLLDLGCGVGNVSVVASKHSCNVVALDVSLNALKGARLRQIKNIHVVNGDALKLPFADESFDVVVAYDLYEHVCDKDGLLKEIRRVTARKGFSALTTGNRLFPFDRHTQLWFIDYLPKKLAKLLNQGNPYEVFQPTYWSLMKKLRKYCEDAKVDGDSALDLVDEVYPTYFQKYRKIITSLKALAKIGVFKFVSPKFIAVMSWGNR